MSYANNDQLDWVGISVSDIAGIRHTQKVQEPEYITELVCWINGSKHTVSNPKPTKLLIEFLHENGLTGAKLACGEGGCGCCTVTLAFPEAGGGTSVLPINACLWPLCALDGCVVTTVEGIGSQKQGLHPIQEAVSLHNGSQCGYCTPGWVMSMYGLMEGPGPEGDLPTAREIEAHFDGNLCRCTGYRPILDAFKGFAGGHGGCGELADIEDCAAYRRSPPLPRAVAKEAAERRGLPLHFVDASTGEEWYRPTSLPGLAVLRSRLAAEGKESRLVCAATSAGVRKYYTGAGGGRPYEQHPRPGEEAPVAIDLRGIPELRGSSASTGGLSAGAAVTLSELIGLLDGASQKGGAEGDPRPVWATLARHLRRVANVQVRNAASWAGNLALARACPGFPSDLATILAAARASVEVGSAEDSGITTSHPVEDYVTGRAPDGLLVAITIPPPAQASGDAGRHSLFQTYKTASRHVNAAAIVNAALWAERDREGRVCAARAVFNGLTGSLLRAKAVEKALVGTPLDEAALGVAMAALEQDVAAAGGVAEDGLHSPGYRMGLTRSYLYKFFLEAQGSLPPELSSALVPFVAAEDRGLSEGTQVYGAGDPSLEPVGEAIPKLRARLQATGEAEYASTARSLAGELHAALVYSHTAARRLLAVDPTDALRAPGAVAFFGKPDIPGANRLASEEEPVFFGAGDVVPAVGCLLGIVVARSASEARAAAKVVRQCFEPESRSCPQPEAVAQLSDARRRRAPESGTKATAAALQRHASSRGSLRGAMRTAAARPSPLSVCIGDPRARVGERRASSGASGGAVSGSLETGGQKHFYMETQSCFVVPKDDGGLEVLASTQSVSLTQQVVARVLDMAEHRVVIKVGQAGGGFGGKLTRGLAIAAACGVAASALGVPVRAHNERLDDLVMTGGREAISADYTAAFTGDGIVEALEMELHGDVGWNPGDGAGSLAMAVGFSDSAYFTEHFSCKATPFRTDCAASTPTRAPGVIQSVLVHEAALEHVARELGLPMEEVQERNFYKPGQKTPFGVRIGTEAHNWPLPGMWRELKEKARFRERKEAAGAFNAANRWRKRGIAMTPVRYGIDDSSARSSALVSAYPDGSVLLSHGGCEIGQGINTKAAQAAALTLGVPMESIRIDATDTSKVPYNSPTGGSTTSETIAKAVEDGCATLRERLAPYLAGGAAFAEAVAAAAEDGVPLSCVGSWVAAPAGDTYSTCGVACSEVEIDVLTGEAQVLATDILMDLGTSLNPAIDIGQLEGGFMMSLGFLLTEEVAYDEAAQPLSLGTWRYKIPSAHDIPLKLNVELYDRPNPSGVFKSKASAEPPMPLAASVYFAVKEAIYAARADVGEVGWFSLRTPVTVEAIQAACCVDPAQFSTVGPSSFELLASSSRCNSD